MKSDSTATVIASNAGHRGRSRVGGDGKPRQRSRSFDAENASDASDDDSFKGSSSSSHHQHLPPRSRRRPTRNGSGSSNGQQTTTTTTVTQRALYVLVALFFLHVLSVLVDMQNFSLTDLFVGGQQKTTTITTTTTTTVHPNGTTITTVRNETVLYTSLTSRRKLENASQQFMNELAADATPTTHKPPLPQHITQPPFPRWTTNGIDFRAILYYLRRQALEPENDRDLLHPNDFPVPNLLYVLGGDCLATPTQRPPQIWVANRRRSKLRNFLRRDRYSVTELMLRSVLKYIAQSTDNPDYARVRELVVPPQNEDPSVPPKCTSPGIPLFINLADYRHCPHRNFNWNNETWTVPIFTLCSHYHAYNCPNALPLPSYLVRNLVWEHTVENNNTWSKTMAQRALQYPWESKRNQVGWRGSATGFAPIDQVLNNSTTKAPNGEPIRLLMVLQAVRGNERLNVSLPQPFDVGYYSVHGSFRDKFNKYDLPNRAIAAKIEFEDFQNYKAVLDVDGNAWSGRFPSLLCLNSVIIKVEPEFADSFHPGNLQPWVHYIPVKMDSSDLWNVTQYVLDPANDAELQGIVQNANAWCLENLQYPKLVKGIAETLKFYVDQLDRGSGSNWTVAFREEIQNDHPSMSQEVNQFQPLPVM